MLYTRLFRIALYRDCQIADNWRRWHRKRVPRIDAFHHRRNSDYPLTDTTVNSAKSERFLQRVRWGLPAVTPAAVKHNWSKQFWGLFGRMIINCRLIWREDECEWAIWLVRESWDIFRKNFFDWSIPLRAHVNEMGVVSRSCFSQIWPKWRVSTQDGEIWYVLLELVA